jgi:PAS domain-containing protein
MKKPNIFGFKERFGTRRILEAHVLFPFFVLLMLCVVWIVSIRLIKIEGAAAEQKLVDTTRELTDIYEAQMIRNLGAIDQTLKTVKYAYEKREQPGVLTELAGKGLLPPKLVFTVSIANRDGQVVESTSTEKPTNVRHQEFFRIHRAENSDQPSINLVKSRSGDRVQFSQRLNMGRATFNGIVMVAVDPGYFTSDYEQARLGDFGVLGLIGASGNFMAQRIGEHVTAGETAFKFPIQINLSQMGDEGVPEVIFVDDLPRYSNARRLFGYPLMVVVGLSKTEQLEGYEKQKWRYIGWSGVASVLLVLFGIVVSRLLWQIAQIQKRTRKNQETYYAASELSNDGVYVMRPEEDKNGKIIDFIVEDVNSRGAEIFGLTKEEIIGEKLCDRLPHCRDDGVLDSLVNVCMTGAIHESEWKTSIPNIKAEWLYRQAVPVEDGEIFPRHDYLHPQR